MTSQWNSKNIGKSLELLQSGVLDDPVVILMQGKNTFGDRIYAYLKLTVKDLTKLKAAMDAGTPFNPSDLGTVVAAGSGEPTDEVKAEIASLYKILNVQPTFDSQSASTPSTPKAWDEY